MAADDFTITPTWVDVLAPLYPNIITVSENYKKDYQNLSGVPVEKFRLRFNGLSDANAETLYEHYKGRYGGYDDFAWKAANIPSYINDYCDLGGTDLTGRWIDKSWKDAIQSRAHNVEIIFERSI